MSEQYTVTPADTDAAKAYADSQFQKSYEMLSATDTNLWYAYFNGYLAGKAANGNATTKQ